MSYEKNIKNCKLRGGGASELVRGQEFKKSGCKANLEGKKIRRYEGKLFTLKSLSSNPPTLLSSKQPSPQPSPIGEGVICHSEPLGERIQPIENKNKLDCFASARNDLGNTYKPYVSDAAATQPLPQGAREKRFPLHPSIKKLAVFTLAEGATHVDTTDNVRRAAFTLAEVLITLGIIGVVAALTMPALVAKYQEMVLKNQFKHAYSLVSQAIKQVEVNNGYPLECYVWPESRGSNACLEYGEDGNCKKWENKGQDTYGRSTDCGIFQSEFEKTVKIIKICENNALEQGCIPEYNGIDTIKKAQDDSLSDVDINKATAGMAWWRKDAIAKDRKAYVLSDGIILLMSGWSGMRIFAIDVNGKRGPNKWGHDLFAVSVSSDSGKSLNLIPCYLAYPLEKGGKTIKQMLSE